MPKQKVRAVLDVMIEVDAPTPEYAVSDVEQLKDVELNIAYATPGVRLVIMTASVRTGMHSDDAPRAVPIEYVIEGNYAGTWEEVAAITEEEGGKAEAQRLLDEYRIAPPRSPHRMRTRHVS